MSAKVLGPWLTSWKSKGENLTHTGSSFSSRLTALGLVILQITPTAAWAAETKQAPKSADKPTSAAKAKWADKPTSAAKPKSVAAPDAPDSYATLGAPPADAAGQEPAAPGGEEEL